MVTSDISIEEKEITSRKTLVLLGLGFAVAMTLLIETILHFLYYRTHGRTFLWQHPNLANDQQFTVYGASEYVPHSQIALGAEFPVPFLNVDRYGFVSTGIDELITADDFVIAVLGGSTVEGRGATSNAATIPALLQAALRTRYPELRIRVINAGHIGDIVYQELNRFQGRIAYRFRPKLVLALDGRNDGFNAASYADHGWRENWIPYFDELTSQINIVMREGGSPALGHVKHLLGRYSMLNAMVWTMLDRSDGPIDYPQSGTPSSAVLKSAASVYINNHILLEQQSRLIGSRYFGFLQPALLDSKKRIAPQERELQKDFERKFLQPVFWGALQQFYDFVREQSDTQP